MNTVTQDTIDVIVVQIPNTTIIFSHVYRARAKEWFARNAVSHLATNACLVYAHDVIQTMDVTFASK